MTSRWNIALAAFGAAAVAAVAVIALSRGGADDAAATVPPGSVPGAEASDTGDARTITVAGHGTVPVVPDVAQLYAGVQAQASTAAEAMDTAGTKSQALVDTLKGLGVAAEDVQTTGINLFPTYGSSGMTITGYQASNSVNVTVHDVDRVAEVVDGLQGFVGEQLTLGGISFSYDDPEAVLQEARTAAIDNARVRAEQYAAAAGVELGEILRVAEGSVTTPAFAREVYPADAVAAVPTPMAVEPGSQDLAADVTVVFAMG